MVRATFSDACSYGSVGQCSVHYSEPSCSARSFRCALLAPGHFPNISADRSVARPHWQPPPFLRPFPRMWFVPSTVGDAVPQGFFLPATQNVLNYGLLAVVFGAAGLCIKPDDERPAQPFKFAAVSFLDVQANYAIVKAYRFTSFTSVTLLDCATIPGTAMRNLAVQPALVPAAHS